MADTGAKLTPGLVGVPPAARPGIWAAFWGWLHSPRQRLLFKRAIAAWGTLFSFAFLRLPVVVAVVWVGVLLLTSLTERTTAIEPISVPKALADRGYTPEVAAYRLRDALNQFAGDALNRPRVMTHSFNMLGFADQQMEAAKIALQTEAPSIVVPTIGLSLDAIATSIRAFFGSERHRTISGEFAIKKDLLWLRLRLDGRELYSSAEGADAESPDELFAKAVPTIFLAIQPYVVASAEKDPEIALKIADAFIARLPNSDENVGWLYTLKGNIYRDSGRFAEAINSLKKASVVSPRLTMPYLLLGLVLSDQGNSDGAIAEYAKAMHLDRNNVNAFNLRGTAYRDRKEYDWAIADYTEAIRLAPKDYDSLNNRGTAYALKSEYDRAIADFTEAIRLDPSNSTRSSSEASRIATGSNMTGPSRT